jgi:hypothetical protein
MREHELLGPLNEAQRAAVSSGCSCDDCVALAAHMAVSSNVAAS